MRKKKREKRAGGVFGGGGGGGGGGARARRAGPGSAFAFYEELQQTLFMIKKMTCILFDVSLPLSDIILVKNFDKLMNLDEPTYLSI